MSSDNDTNASIETGRRDFLKITAGGAAAAGLAGCSSVLGSSGTDTPTGPTEDDPLQVEFFGGVFKEVLDEVLVPPFEEETGIPVESSAGTTGELAQIQQAVQAGEAPVDLFVQTPNSRIRGRRRDLWHTYDPGELDNADVVLDDLLPKTEDGQVVGAGAFGWFATLVSQTDLVEEPLDSWSVFWDDQYSGGNLGLSNDHASGILDVTAEMYFDGQETLQTEEGITQVMEKIQEIKSRVGLWYDGEAQAQQALLDENITASWLFHDVTLVMEDEGQPVKSVFPQEGAVQNDGVWTILESTDYPEAAVEFVDFSLRPEIQTKISENLFTAPVIEESALDMSEDTYQRVYGPGPDAALRPFYEMYIDRQEWLSQTWREMVLS